MARPLAALAWLNVGLHVAGLGLAAAFIRPGSPLTSLPERITYLAGRPPGWALAWWVWVASAVAMVCFAYAVSRRLAVPLGRWGLATAAVAATVDLACDEQYILALPKLAFNSGGSPDSFAPFERLLNFLSLTVANGLYSVSTLLLTLAVRRRPGLVRGTVAVGVGVFIFGMMLSLAGLTGVPDHAFWATPPTIGLYCVWVLLMERSLIREGHL
jgi:hypothetical protein